MKAAVFGAHGFIGGHLSRRLQEQGWDVLALSRGDERWRGRRLGHVFYCAGLTADFRTRPFETIDAHISFAAEVLRAADFDSFLYCSSTRVYAGCERAVETARLSVDPADPGDLYNLSKLMGEAACLALPRPEVRVARLSNVFGDDPTSDNFLNSVLCAAVRDGRVVLQSDPGSSKDYVAVEDAAEAMVRIALHGAERLYNVAAGRNTSHGEILASLRAATGCRIETPAGETPQVFAAIAVERLKALGGWAPADVLDRLPALIKGLQGLQSNTP